MNGWIDEAPGLLTVAAARWSLALDGYHDAGHASVIATAAAADGSRVLVKAWPDRDRYSREIRALRLWHREPDGIVLAADDDLSVAALALVGGAPGGAARPAHETSLVSAALHRAHGRGRSEPGLSMFPQLHDHITDEVLPRVRRRLGATALGPRTESALWHAAGVREHPARETLLHGDLYRENVPFTEDGRPVLLDPLPMSGDVAYDWAFWTVYYEVGRGTGGRLHRASLVSGVSVKDLLPWCLLLGLDGLLYYEETGDARMTLMTRVLDALLARCTE
ncbi:aminoglycoside phosphotransferase family protein [Streptomyces wuyuanensis]|uniref:aminoglycoside phosphotransferase family protein n=1 Tax=Streptomyces wuyuanensis TaxID=1196353 RepID=UPI00371AFADC